jgi:hypothetical protein
MRRPRFPQTEVDYSALRGGLDLVTPRTQLNAGRVIDAQNYEPLPVGGYRRINGFERFDGNTSPTSATYSVMTATISGTFAVGATVTGATSGATGKVLALAGSALVLGRVAGTFVSGENLQVGGVTQGVATSAAVQGGADTALLNASYKLLAANDRRADIGVVPGSGQVRGIFVLADTVYALRDNAGATASLMYKATPAGWVQVTFGKELRLGVRTSSVTISAANPGVVTWTGHGLSNGQTVAFTTTGTLPGGLTAGANYFVVAAAANTFQVSATSGGTSIDTSAGGGSGTHTAKLTSGAGFGVGDTVTGAASGATGVVTASLLMTGTWAVDPVGSLVFASTTGTFSSGEALSVGGVTRAQSTSASTQITRAAGGRVETVVGNFTGSATTRKAYGVDGVNPGFEFDGTTYVPIHTGQSIDTPTHVEVHKNKLFYSFASSLQYSATNNPYAWTALAGAAELGMGDVITTLLSQTGNASGASLAVFTRGKTSILYGSSSADFQLIPSIYDLGYLAYTVQAVSNNSYGLTARGVQALITTLNYGDFSFDAVSFSVQPLVQTKYASACASVTLRGKNQYRLYFSDGSALAFGLTGEKLSGIMPLNYGKTVRCIWNSVWTTGAEHTYFGSDDGYVYEESVGTSFDGAAIEAWIRPGFNNLGSPRVNKRYRRAIFEVDVEGYAAVNIGYDLGYANPNVEPAAMQADQTLTGAGMYWDALTATWENFTWDAPVLAQPEISIDGSDNNIGFLFHSNSAIDDPITAQGVSLLYTSRHVTR